jgi:hypothetical protein
MIPLAVLDILADDWIRSRRESAAPFGNRPYRIVTWLAALRRERPQLALAPVVVVTPGQTRSDRAA